MAEKMLGGSELLSKLNKSYRKILDEISNYNEQVSNEDHRIPMNNALKELLSDKIVTL